MPRPTPRRFAGTTRTSTGVQGHLRESTPAVLRGPLFTRDPEPLPFRGPHTALSDADGARLSRPFRRAEPKQNQGRWVVEAARGSHTRYIASVRSCRRDHHDLLKPGTEP